MDFDLDLLLSVIGGLGKSCEQPGDRTVYIRDDDCIACLKDIQRFLRNDDSQSRETFFTLGEFDIAKHHLMPLITTYPGDVDVVFNALKVATWMTMPLEPGSDNPALQLRNMQNVREAVLAGDTLKVIFGLLAAPVAHHPRMSEQEASLVQLVVCFARNLLSIPDARATDSSRGDHRSRLRDELLFRLDTDHMLELFIMFASESDKHPFARDAPLLLEVFQSIFHGMQPSAVLAAKYTKPKAAKSSRPMPNRVAAAAVPAWQPQTAAQVAAGAAAAQKMQLERARRMERSRAEALRRAQACVPRHARFGATFVQRDSSGRQVGRVSAPAAPGSAGAFVQAFVKAPPYGNAFKSKPVPAQALQPTTTVRQSLLALLAKYADAFLGKPYEKLMGNVRKDLDAGLGISRLPRTAFVHFMQLAAFCTNYVRLKQERFIALSPEKQRAELAAGGPIDQCTAAEGSSAAVEVQSPHSPFTVVQASMGWDTFHMLHKTWLDVINTPPSSPEKDWELQHVTTAFLRQFLAIVDLAADSNSRQDRQASDRLQRRMLHDDMKESGLLPVLAKLVKDFSARRSSRMYAADLVAALHSTMRLLTRLSLSENGGFLVKRRGGSGVGQGRRKQPPADAAPANGGDQDVDSSVEAADASRATGDNADADTTDPNGEVAEEGADEPAWDRGEDEEEEEGGGEGGSEKDGTQRQDPFEEEDREERRRQATREVAYDLKKRLVQEMAYPNVVHFYVWLLSGYQHNEAATNHHVISFLQRICHPTRGLDMEAMLYQVTVLRIFRDMLDDRNLLRAPAGQEIAPFIRGVLRNMFRRLVPPVPTQNSVESEVPTAAEASMAPDFGTEWPSCDPRDEGDSAAASVAAAAQAQEAVQLEAKAKQACGQLLFLELLFWKNAKISSEIRDEYNWRDDGGVQSDSIFTPAQDELLKRAWEEVGSCPGAVDAVTAQMSRSGHHLPRTSVASRLKALGLKRGVLTEVQDAQIKELWEQQGGLKGAAASIGAEMGLKKSVVAKRLKVFGLKHGVLTDAQTAALRAAHEKYGKGRGALAVIASEMEWRFTKGQLSRHLRNLGLTIPKTKGASNPNGAKSSGSSSSSSSGDDNSSSSGSGLDLMPLRAAKPAKTKRKQAQPPPRSTVNGRRPLQKIGLTDSSDSDDSSRGGPSDISASRPSAVVRQSGGGAARPSSPTPPHAPLLLPTAYAEAIAASVVTQQRHQDSDPPPDSSDEGSDMELFLENEGPEALGKRSPAVQPQPVAGREGSHGQRHAAVASSARSELEELKAARRRNIENAAAARAAAAAPPLPLPPEAVTSPPPDTLQATIPPEASPSGHTSPTAEPVVAKKRRLIRKTVTEPEQTLVAEDDELEDF